MSQPNLSRESAAEIADTSGAQDRRRFLELTRNAALVAPAAALLLTASTQMAAPYGGGGGPQGNNGNGNGGGDGVPGNSGFPDGTR